MVYKELVFCATYVTDAGRGRDGTGAERDVLNIIANHIFSGPSLSRSVHVKTGYVCRNRHTEPSARRVLNSHTQHLIRYANSSVAVVALTPGWFATTLPEESGVKQPVVFRRCVEVYLLGTLVPSYTSFKAFHQA